MLESLKQDVCQANISLQEHGLVLFTWGNVSGIDRVSGLVVIKPSGVPYENLTPDKMVVLDLDGKIVEGTLRPSSDTPTHLELYRRFPEIGGVVHTHSSWAVAWSQAGCGIPCFGTTHADYFYGEVPCTRTMTGEEISSEYELNTGKVIVDTFRGTDYMDVPGVLVSNHGPFTWGKDPDEAVHNSVVLEEVARMAHATVQLNPNQVPIARRLLDKHFLRKHGTDAYYGQK